MPVNEEIPRSRLTLTYRTTVHGEPQDVTLPFRLLIMGDLSGGTSTDRKLDLDLRKIRLLDGKNLNSAMADMAMSVKLTVPNRIDPDKAEEMAVELPITSMKSFQPAEVAKHVPKVHALLLLKKLLLEVQANLDNRKEFRRLLRSLAQDKDAIASLADELKGYEAFKVPAGKAADGETA
jgi:type VI secretion system protein ImpB